MRWCRLSGLVLVLLAMNHITLAATPSAGLIAQGEVQTEIRAVVAGLTGSRNEEQRQTAMTVAAELGQRPDGNRVQLVEQLAIFLAVAGGTEEAMGGALLFHALEFQRDEVLAATLPHLLAVPPEQSKILQERAATTLAAGGLDPVSVVLEIEELRAGRHGGGAAAGTADDATRRTAMGELLVTLAGSDDPWVKAYGAAVVSADPDLVSAEIRSRLMKP